MTESAFSERLHLRDGELRRCGLGRDAWLTVVCGCVWVTQAGDPDDHFLGAGQAMRLVPGAHALVGAEGDAQVIVMHGPSRLQRVRRSTMAFLLRPAAPVP